MEYVDVKTQAELEKVLKKGNIPNCRGNGAFRAYGSSQVTAYGSSQVTACDSSQVTAFDSSQVKASDSSHVTACDSSQVRAYGSSQVTASAFVAVTIHGKTSKVKGGKIIRIPVITTAVQWCKFYGVEIKSGVAVMFKAVRNDFKSKRGMEYTPGSTPKAPDWDNGKEECGGGLHFSPRPFMALKFDLEATRFVGCPIKVSEIVVHKDAQYPDKIKAPRVYKPCFEVDIDGNPIRKA